MMDKVLDRSLKIIEIKLRQYSYINFWTNNFGKGMNYLIPSAKG